MIDLIKDTNHFLKSQEAYKKLVKTNLNMTAEVQIAIAHVKKHHPTLKYVIFTNDCRWCYMDNDFEAFKFGPDINVSILEEAIDSLGELPRVFEV